jgi:hypothetical protein
MSQSETLSSRHQTTSAWRQPAGLVARFDLNGGMRDPEAPIQQSTKVEMFLNLKTAKALGITVVPLPLAGRADEVLE